MFFQNKLYRMGVICICLFIIGVASIQAEEEKKSQGEYPSMPGMQGMTPEMQKSMDPNTWFQLMARAMNPKESSSAIESCALCHEGEDIARYQKDFGPMLEPLHQLHKIIVNPNMMSTMMNPAMYMNMMYPMMGSMMNPMSMMYPMMGSMMNPMAMMNPAMYMNMMYPMMGGMGMPGMGMPGMGMHGGNPMGQMPGGQMMDPKQYENWFNEMMKNFSQPAQQPKQ